MDQIPIITTVIPTFDRATLLRRAVRSALNQTYRHVRVCVYDNASTDETPQTVAALCDQDERVRYYRHPENIGATPNFNFGLKNVQTDYFSVLSDDDVLLPRFYEAALEGFASHPEAIFSACSVLRVTPAGKIEHVPFATWPRMGMFVPPEGLRRIVSGDHPTITGVLFRTEVIRECGVFDPQLTLADLDFEIRVASRFPYVTTAEPGALFVPHSGSESWRVGLQDLWREYQRILEKINQDDRVPVFTREVGVTGLRSYLRRSIRGLALRAVARGEAIDAGLAVELLGHHLDGRRDAALVRALTIVHRLPFAGSLLRSIHSVAKAARRHSLGSFQGRYGGHTQHLRSE